MMKVQKGFFVVLACFFTLFLSATEGNSHTIYANVDGVGGSISPSGAITVPEGGDQTFTIAPSADVVDVLVDGGSVGAVSSYPFTNVTADHSITVSFVCYGSQPVMLEGGGLYDTIMGAYDSAIASEDYDFTIKLMAGTLSEENIVFDAAAAVVLEGGNDCSFLDNDMTTTIPGSLTIAAGTVIIPSNIVLSTLPCIPTGPEICDGIDNDCNGLIDDGLSFDVDGDGHYTPDSCYTSSPNDDCDDFDPYTYPGAAELCDGMDNNCNGQVDEGLSPVDNDGDGYYSVASCGSINGDCNDNDPDIHPGAWEIFGDGIDQNCDGYDLLDPALENQCFECHGLARVNEIMHNDVEPPGGATDCASCHAVELSSILEGHYGRTVRETYNNMVPGQVIVCTSCHDAHDEDEFVINGDFVVWAKIDPDFSGPPYNYTCDNCHENRAAAHVTGTAHDHRVISTVCADCHTSDTSILGQPGSGTLTSQADVDILHGNGDCSLCHNYTGTDIDPAIVQLAIQNGLNGADISCLACHGETFATVHEFLTGHYNLVRVGTTSCGNCHSDAPPLIDTGNPKVHQACTNCHDAAYNTIGLAAGIHFADYAPPNLPGDCTICHGDVFPTIHEDASVDHSAIVTVDSTSCGDCHDDPPPLTDAADPKVHNSCATCHDNNGDLIGRAAGKTFAAGGDCTTCHTDTFPIIHEDADVDHSAIVKVGTTGCGDCHNDMPLIDAADPKVHNSCATCHDSEGGLISLAAGKSFAAGGDCTTCHTDPFDTIHPDTIDHSAIVTTAGTYCADCHSDPPPLTDPGDPLVHNSCSTCHDTEGSLTGLASGQSFDPGGNCSTCHGADFPTIHEDADVDHSAIVTVDSTSCGNCHSDPPPLTDPADPKVHNACSTCHDSTGGLISLATGKSFATGGDCTTCHTDPFDIIHPDTIDHSAIVTTEGTQCGACHTSSALVDPLNPLVHFSCATCHDDYGGLISLAAGHSFAEGGNCTTCHGSDLNDIHGDVTGAHDATPGSDYVLVFAAGEHDPAMVGDGEVYVDCVTCHNTNLISVHASQCSTCHPSPYDTLGGTWSGGCQQGGCHVTKHVDASDSHNAVTNNDNCTYCHDSGTWDVPQTNCANCHAINDPGDTEAPVTTSDVQPEYVLPTYIHFSATDNGGKVFLGRTFYILDYGDTHVGSSSILVTAYGSHHIEYWSVDQAGNEELPHNEADFDNLNDIMPPVTTSDVQPVYNQIPANITLTATDDNAAGIITTYYSLNGGDPEEGTSIYIPEQLGIVDYTLEFWSVDWTGNVETPTNTANFKMVSGTGTIRLVWGDSDTTGSSPCLDDPLAEVHWEINDGGPTYSGSAGCSTDPDWSGVNDVVVPLSASTYYVDIFWSDSYVTDELVEYPNVSVSEPGQVVRLPY